MKQALEQGVPNAWPDIEGRLRKHAGRAGLSPRGLAFRRLEPTPYDARLFFGPRALDGPAGEALVDRLAQEPWVAEARRRGGDLALRLAEDAAFELELALGGEALAPLFPPALPGAPGATGTWVVNYLNPNATKPLHVGHLRNVAIGRALAAGLAQAGLPVATQCYVCDVGRNVCEALAGWIELYGEADPPPGTRSDAFVGECYARYASAAARAAGRSLEELDPIAAEAILSGDHADLLLGAWLRGDPRVRGLWQRLRGWALDGQARTLERLGAAPGRMLHESRAVEPALALARRGLELGLFEREPDGGIVYRTGRPEYPCAQLVRADGFPTEHLRVIALFVDEQREAAGVARWIVVCGDEWNAAGDVELEIAERLGPCPLRPLVEVLAHGMVTLAGSKMKSRDGRAALIDDVLDELEASTAVRALRAEGGADAPPAAELVELASKGSFLARKPVKAVAFEPERLVDERANPGWLLARAWCRAEVAARGAGGASEDPEPVRSAALQLYQLRQLVSGAPAGYAGTELAKHAVGVARWYLARADAGRAPRLARVVRGVLALSFGALGLRAGARYRNITSK